jgi:transposase InsO family protein
MDQRAKFISEWNSHSMTMTALCRLFGISRQTGHKLVRQQKREATIAEKSRRPKSHPKTTSPKLVKLIVSQRRQFPLWGPAKIRQRLRLHWPQHKWPSVSTIGAILKREGLVKPRRFRRRAAPRTRPFGAVREPNDLWCVDFKGQFVMGNGRVCYPLTVTDGASRYLLACVAFHEPTLANVRDAFVDLFRRYGLPRAIRSDNGEPFASTSTAGGLTQLSAWWARLGIRLERIDPGKPQQNSRHERMHRTLKQATCSPPRRSLGWQQRAFDRFQAEYNDVRPHEALAFATPGSLYVRSHTPYPAQLPDLHYPFADIHRVRSDGTIAFRQRRQFISTSLAGELVGLYQVDERYVEVVFTNVVLGLIDTRNNNANPRVNLVRPGYGHGKKKPTRVSAIYPV